MINEEGAITGLLTEPCSVRESDQLRPATANVNAEEPGRAWTAVPFNQLYERAHCLNSSPTAISGASALHRSSLVPPLSDLATTASLSQPPPPPAPPPRRPLSLQPFPTGFARAGGAGLIPNDGRSGGGGVLGPAAPRQSSCLAATTPTLAAGSAVLRPYHNLHQLAGFEAPPPPPIPPLLLAVADRCASTTVGQRALLQRSHSGVVRARSATYQVLRGGAPRGLPAAAGIGAAGELVAAATAAAGLPAGGQASALSSLARRAHSTMNISSLQGFLQLRHTNGATGGDEEGVCGAVAASATLAAAPGAEADCTTGGDRVVVAQPRGLMMRSWRSLVSVANRGSVGDTCNGENGTMADCTGADCTAADDCTNADDVTGGSSTVMGAPIHSGWSPRAASGGECSVLSAAGDGGGYARDDGGGGGRGGDGSCTARPSGAGEPQAAALGAPGVVRSWHRTTSAVQWARFRPFTDMGGVPSRSFHLVTAFVFIACLSTFAPAALLSAAQPDLELSGAAVGGAAAAALVIPALAHFPLSAWWLRWVGPRYTQVLVLLLTAPALACMALVRSAPGFLLVRLISGASLLAFTCAQFWLGATVRACELPSAIATSASWGTAGAGVGLLVMPLLASGLQRWQPPTTAWRSAFYLPATAHVALAFATFLLGQDTAAGDFLDRRKVPYLYRGGRHAGLSGVELLSPPRRSSASRVPSGTRRPGGPPSAAPPPLPPVDDRRRLAPGQGSPPLSSPPPPAAPVGDGGSSGGGTAAEEEQRRVVLEVASLSGLDLVTNGGEGGRAPVVHASLPATAAAAAAYGGNGGARRQVRTAAQQPLGPVFEWPPPPAPAPPPPPPPPPCAPATSPPIAPGIPPPLQLLVPPPLAEAALSTAPPAAQAWLGERASPPAGHHTSGSTGHHNRHNHLAPDMPLQKTLDGTHSRTHSGPASALAPPQHNASAPSSAYDSPSPYPSRAPSPVPQSRPSPSRTATVLERPSHARLVSDLATLRELDGAGDSCGEGGGADYGECTAVAGTLGRLRSPTLAGSVGATHSRDASGVTGGPLPRTCSSLAAAATATTATATAGNCSRLSTTLGMVTSEQQQQQEDYEALLHAPARDAYGQPYDVSYTYGVALTDRFVLALALGYGCCFGSQLVALNTLPAYLAAGFRLRPVPAGAVAAMVGLAQLICRPAGGWLVAETARAAAAERSCSGGRCGLGMRGRLWLLWVTQTAGGLFCALMGGVAGSSLPATVLLVGLFAAASGAACGMLLVLSGLLAAQRCRGSSCSPPSAISASATAAAASHYMVVADVVFGGGLVGAVGLQAACFSHGGMSYAAGWIWMGLAIMAAALLTALLAATGSCCCGGDGDWNDGGGSDGEGPLPGDELPCGV